MKATLAVLFTVLFSCAASAGVVSLIADTATPLPEEEVTVWVYSEDPLFCLAMGVYVTGDATITAAMGEADCADYGWDNGWNSDAYIDPSGWLALSGVRWAADAVGVVSYFKFRYHSGQVAVYIDQDYCDAFGWDGNSTPHSTFSTDTLLFGEPESLSVETSLAVRPEKPAPQLISCPAGESLLPQSFTPRDILLTAEQSENGELQLNELDSDPTVIYVSSDITTNQIWTADNIYYVTTNVQVQALLVIEPDTTVVFDYYGALIVNNGGTLLSVGRPDQPIIYTAADPYGWGDYEYAIYVQETASPATKIVYSYIECAFIAIRTDNIRLDNPIENNILFYNNCGILEYGTQHTDIINNLIAFGFNWNYYSYAIKVYMESQTGGDAESVVLIQNNTCDDFDYGVTIHGTDIQADAGTVLLKNNIVSGSYEVGLNLVDDYMLAIVANNGYYNNAANKNWVFDEYDPVQATTLPYMAGTLWYEGYHLSQTSPFVNAGAEYIEQTRLIGMTTDTADQPDSGMVDLGYHYPNWNYANAGTGLAASDFNEDGIADTADLLALLSQWLENVTPGATGDLHEDGQINLADFTLFAENWQKTQGYPNISFTVDQNPNNTGGILTLSANVALPRI